MEAGYYLMRELGLGVEWGWGLGVGGISFGSTGSRSELLSVCFISSVMN